MHYIQPKASFMQVSPGGTTVKPDPEEEHDAWSEGLAKKHYNAWDTWNDEEENEY